jgi:hypothetical protein
MTEDSSCETSLSQHAVVKGAENFAERVGVDQDFFGSNALGANSAIPVWHLDHRTRKGKPKVCNQPRCNSAFIEEEVPRSRNDMAVNLSSAH